MGVPRLYKWINDNFKETIKKFEVTDNGVHLGINIDNFYIDSNAIIHNCAQRVYNYGSNKNFMDPYSKLNNNEKELLLFKFYINEIINLTKIVKPKKILYLAIDGCAPAGKMMQQRQRRFLSINSNTSSFNSSCISPGTKFMDRLHQYCLYELLKYFNNDFEIIFSGNDVPGEGEHKIMNYVRENNKYDESHCMYGPDADLIMLILASHCNNFYLLKDDLILINHLCMIDMGKVKIELSKKLKGKIIQNAIDDFILLGFLVGNDFLPKIQIFYLLEDGLDMMVGIYNKICKGDIFLTSNGNINYEIFHKFMENLAELEYDMLYLQLNKYTAGDKKFENKTLIECSIRSQNGIIFDYDKYKNLYYSKFNIQNKKNIVDEYIQGLDWVFKYYTQECISYKWFYPHYYAPLIFDVLTLFNNKYNFQYTSQDKICHSQFQQLLSILPPSSHYLLPKKLGNLMIDKNSPIIDFYPTEFNIDYEGKYQEYQGIPILPINDYDKLRKVYENTFIKKCKRNMVGKIYHITYNEKSIKYKTRYGSITANAIL